MTTVSPVDQHRPIEVIVTERPIDVVSFGTWEDAHDFAAEISRRNGGKRMYIYAIEAKCQLTVTKND